MMRQERYHIFKQSVWCCARVEADRGRVVFKDPDWQVVMKFAVMYSEGKADKFREWLTIYDLALDLECKRLLRRLKA